MVAHRAAVALPGRLLSLAAPLDGPAVFIGCCAHSCVQRGRLGGVQVLVGKRVGSAWELVPLGSACDGACS